MTLRIVTDSTSDLPTEWVKQYGITVIPAYVNFGAQSYADGIDLTRKEFYTRLPTATPPPTTSAPGPGQFTSVYEQLAQTGATDILSIHIGATWSSIYSTAATVAQEVKTANVVTFDAGQLSMGLGWIVMAAARAAAAGASLSDILQQLKAVGPRTFTFAALDTVDHLRRSGRVNVVEAGLATLLQIKPLIKVNQGAIVTERVRSRGQAQKRIIELVAELGPLEHLAVLHTNAPDRAAEVLQQLRPYYPEGDIPVEEVTPLIGTHVGANAVGAACVKK